MLNRLFLWLSTLRLVPHLLLYGLHPNRAVMRADVVRWSAVLNLHGGEHSALVHILTYYPEFRNLFYHRAGLSSRYISWLAPKMETLFINTADIGPGLFIQHGFATIIEAKSVGKNCWINQQVTIGYSSKTATPVIGDDVTITAGAKIIGGLTVGDGAVIGANAVVVKDVPGGCTVVGVPAHIVRRNGQKVREPL